MGEQSVSTRTAAPTLDQLRLFVSVADRGSFSAAARHLRRAQSAVSYGIANLERQLGVTLFDRGGRRPALTGAGRSLLHDARQVLGRVGRLQQRAAAVAGGLESDVAVVFDAIVPATLIAQACRAFQARHPTVSLRLHSEVIDGVPALVREGVCSVGVGTSLVADTSGLRARFVTQIGLVPVVAAGHPLAALPAPIATPAVRDHVQIVITQRSVVTEGADHSVLSARTWRVADATTKLELIRAGLGWGNLPIDMVRDDLRAGQLARLVLEEWGDQPLAAPIAALVREDAPPGPAGRWLVDTLVAIGARHASSAK